MANVGKSSLTLAARMVCALALVAGIAFVYLRVFRVNSVTVALTLLLAILALATRWGLLEAMLASIFAVLCFNFFFLPPVGTFTIADPENWVALFVFLATAVVASHLSASAKQRALEATRRQHEMERLYALSRGLMLLDSNSAIAGQIAYQIADVFGFPGVAFFDRESGEVCRAGSREVCVSDSKLRDAAVQGTGSHDVPADATILPVSLGGRPIGSLAILGGGVSDTALHAITNLAAIALERARAQEAASQAEVTRRNEQLKSTLLDALAHEFKTPLTSVKAAASAMLGDADAPQRELLTVIDEETDRLDTLVTEAIEMARIEAGNIQLHKQLQDTADLVRGALAKLRISFDDRRIQISLPERLPPVYADVELVGLVIRQLVDNALKYSRPDSPIAVRARAEEDHVIISVSDSGPGIPEKEQSRIFDKFYRIPDSAVRIPGTGMGLTIARDIVHAHGGRIWVTSRAGEGSEFFFTLPSSSREVTG